MFKYGIILLLAIFSSAYGKIYDCFMFFNEFEILEIRLHELYDVVDKFVILEASESFTGFEKPHYFELEKERYREFSDKIIHIKFDKKIDTEDAWVRERFDRNHLILGLLDCEADDIVIISDADEILSADTVKQLPSLLEKHNFVGFSQRMYSYFLNRINPTFWPGICATTYGYMLSYNLYPEDIRNMALQEHCRKSYNTPIYSSGWHFTSMGGYDRFLEKKRSCSHWNDYPTPSYVEWREWVEEYELVRIGKYHPKFVKENIEYFKELGFIDVP